MTSGATRACSQANMRPVRPKPVSTSSAISSVPWRSQRRRTPARYSGGCMIMPPTPCSIGSTSTPAARGPSASSCASRAARHSSLPRVRIRPSGPG